MANWMEREFRHWTRAGVFRLTRVNKLGMDVWEAHFNDLMLATYPNPVIAAIDIASGEFDTALPETASSLGVPDAYLLWNMLK